MQSYFSYKISLFLIEIDGEINIGIDKKMQILAGDEVKFHQSTLLLL